MLLSFYLCLKTLKTQVTRVYNYTFQAQIPVYVGNTTIQYYVKAVDDTGDTNRTQISNYTVFLSLSPPPAWSAPWNSSLAGFNASESIVFNVTWTDDGAIGNVSMEVNRSGTVATYYPANTTADVYSLSLSNFPAGTHYWRSNATDNDAFTNSTSWFAFTIPQASPSLSLTFNGTAGNLSIDQNGTIWLNGSLTYGDGGTRLELYLNSTLLSNSTSPANLTEFTTLGTYEIALFYRETQNFTSGNVSYVLTMLEIPPIVLSHSPTGTVTTSSTTLSTTSDKNATCRYATSSGTAFENMSALSGNETTHTASLSGLTDGTYHYYVRCNSSTGRVSTSDYDASFTVDIADTPSSGSGGGGGAPVADPNKKETTYASLSAGKENTLVVDRSAIAATKVGFVNTATATNVKLSVSTVNTTSLENPLDAAYGYFNVTLTGLPDNELNNAWIEFKVNTSWIAEQGSSKSDVRLKRQHNAWEELPTAWTKDSGAHSYFNASTTGFSVFAIALVARMPPAVVEPEPEPEENLTEPQPGPKANATVEPRTNATEQPGPSVGPASNRIVVGLLSFMLLTLSVAGYLYLRKRR